MPKKYEFPKLELKIDGRQLPAGKASLLFQKDPYPGGHSYSAAIYRKGLDKLFDYLPIGKSKNISEDIARRFFMTMSFCGWVLPPEEDNDSEYFLNSVEEIDFDGKQIKFSGVCSEIIRN